MAQQLFVKNSITINASPARVWDALTNPEQTKKYMFGCETVSDWKKGSLLEWKGQQDGKDIVYVKGDIIDIKPEKLLIYETIDTLSPIDESSEQFLNVTYELVPQGNSTVLNVTQGDYAKVNEGDRRYKEADNNGEGWNPILVEIKKLVESEN
jgi:uncharacterized protein YndB with AHSA1/START domain